VRLQGWLAERLDGRRERRREDPLWPRALAAGKSAASALTLWIFVGGITLDDLHLFRFPSLYPGAGLAVLAYAVAPPVFAARLLGRLEADAHPDVPRAVEGTVLRRRAFLALTAGLFVVWLALFSSGETPRW
jgi:hypothetical protein